VAKERFGCTRLTLRSRRRRVAPFCFSLLSGPARLSLGLGAYNMRAQSTSRVIKAAAATLAYIPMVVLIVMSALQQKSIGGAALGKSLTTGCAIFNFPAFSLLALIETFHVSSSILALSAVALMFAWSSFLAWFFWRAAGTFLGEDEAPDQHGKYDWQGFQVRFVIGFVLGCLFGWRLVADTTSMKTMFTACGITGVVAGLLFGLSRPASLWSRP
jgi:hypothetical protein